MLMLLSSTRTIFKYHKLVLRQGSSTSIIWKKVLLGFLKCSTTHCISAPLQPHALSSNHSRKFTVLYWSRRRQNLNREKGHVSEQCTRQGQHKCVCVNMCVCASVCAYVCMCLCLHVHMCVCAGACVCVMFCYGNKTSMQINFKRRFILACAFGGVSLWSTGSFTTDLK